MYFAAVSGVARPYDEQVERIRSAEPFIGDRAAYDAALARWDAIALVGACARGGLDPAAARGMLASMGSR